MRRIVIAAILTLAPGLALAQACSGPMTCAPGQVWDPELRVCTDQLIG